MQEKIKQLLSNLDKIPKDLWEETDGGKYKVIWLMDRQKPSVQADYSFDEERVGITDKGDIIWGFDSGCSCTSPWSSGDFGDDIYDTAPTYKEFLLNVSSFDEGWEKDCEVKVEELLSKIN